MADKIAKLLAKLPPKQLKAILEVLVKINQGKLEGLDVKSLKGHQDKYRVRVGTYRIIFTVNEQRENTVLLIAKRNEKTYKDL